jgi:hypothetical protein
MQPVPRRPAPLFSFAALRCPDGPYTHCAFGSVLHDWEDQMGCCLKSGLGLLY